MYTSNFKYKLSTFLLMLIESNCAQRPYFNFFSNFFCIFGIHSFLVIPCISPLFKFLLLPGGFPALLSLACDHIYT